MHYHYRKWCVKIPELEEYFEYIETLETTEYPNYDKIYSLFNRMRLKCISTTMKNAFPKLCQRQR